MLKTKILSALLTGALLLSNLPSVYAAIETPGGSNDVPTVVDAEQARFSVIVPTNLPIAVSSDGVVTTADDVKIVNNSAGPVVVTGLSVDPQNSWSLVDYDTDFGSGKVNEKKLGLVLQGNEVQTDGSCGLSGFSSIAGGTSIDFTYDANVAVQTKSISSETVANVVFTIGWDSTTPPVEPEEEFTVTYIAGENGSVNESSRSFKSGANLTFPFTTPFEGYAFDKWVDSSTELEVTGSTTVNSDMTVKAVFKKSDIVDEVALLDYYTFTDDTFNTGGWKVGLNDTFKDALNKQSPSAYKEWNPGEPLPALPSTYQGKPITNMSEMFFNLYNFTSLNLSKFDTSNVTDMSDMFHYCAGLTSLDVSNFNTSNVTNMSNMFYNCWELTSLDVSNFDTSNVTNMEGMFGICYGLTSLDVSDFDTSNVMNMASMFHGCSGLTSLNLNNFDTSNVTSMKYMFIGCEGLTSLNLSSFDTSNVASMEEMFKGCSGLTSLNVSSFNTSNVTNIDLMFYNCGSLTSLDLSNFDTGNITNMGNLFGGCCALTSLDVSSFDTSNVTSMYAMFSNCGELTSLDVSSFDTRNVTDMGSMFMHCAGLTSLDLSNFDTSNVTSMGYMFYNCDKLNACYGRTQEDCNRLNSSSDKPSNVNFIVKP